MHIYIEMDFVSWLLRVEKLMRVGRVMFNDLNLLEVCRLKAPNIQAPIQVNVFLPQLNLSLFKINASKIMK